MNQGLWIGEWHYRWTSWYIMIFFQSCTVWRSGVKSFSQCQRTCYVMFHCTLCILHCYMHVFDDFWYYSTESFWSVWGWSCVPCSRLRCRVRKHRSWAVLSPWTMEQWMAVVMVSIKGGATEWMVDGGTSYQNGWYEGSPILGNSRIEQPRNLRIIAVPDE